MVTRTPGSHNWAAGFAAVPETQVVAVFDHGAETRAAFKECWSDQWPGVELFDGYDRMLAETRPDVVCVATRQTMHAEQIVAAVAAGVRGVLCDKPLATSLTEMDRIVAACRSARVPLAFGLDRRWSTRYRAARQTVESGAIGRVTGVLAYGVPNLINHGCHWYDTALSLAGDAEIAWVSGLVDDVSSEPEGSSRRRDPAGRAQIGLASGVTAYVTPDGGPGLAFEVLGDKGRLLLMNDGRDAQLWSAAPAAASGDPAPRGPQGLRLQPLEWPEPETGWPAGPAAVRDLACAIREGRSTVCDVDEARRATEVGFAIHTSSAAGGARVALADVDRTLRIESLPWGNE